MTELGQLEAKHAEFEKRNARIVVVSLEDVKTAGDTQKDYPHLVVLADPDEELAKAVNGLHPNANPTGGNAYAPTTIVLDGSGTVRWWARDARHIHRPAPEEVLAAIDEHVLKENGT